MANVLTENFDYTYNGKEVLEFFVKPSIDTPDFKSLFMVMPGIRSKAQLPLVPNLSKITKTHAGCTRNYSDGVTITNRTIETAHLQVLMEQCEDQFEGSILEELLKSGVDVNDLTGTAFDTLIQNLVLDGMRRDNFRILSFGDTGDGDANWNQLDGLWTRALAGLSDYCVNQAGTQFSSGALSSGEAKDVLKSLYEDADNTLKQMPTNDKKFFVTGDVFENYITYLETQSNSEGWKVEQEGMPRAFYRGVEVLPIYAWDESLADTTCPLYGIYSHLALYTTPKNHVIGLDAVQDDSKTRRWFSMDDAKYRIEAAYRLGYNYKQCDLQIIAVG